MAWEFTVEKLVQDAMPQALPLVRATWPEIDLAAWLRFAAAFRDGHPSRRAITAMADASGGICGLFASRIEQRIGEGRVLEVPLFTVVDIGNSPQPLRALLDAAEAKAREHGCVGIQIWLADEQSELIKRLQGLGFRSSGTSYFSALAIASGA
jgi:GNAT superfamily N-acetyltransferase